jgi:hypothetical protein
MTDSSTPLSVQELEVLLETVARNLLEKWAIEDRFPEEKLLDYVQYSVDDTAFVINNYMEVLNDLMINRAVDSKIIT